MNDWSQSNGRYPQGYPPGYPQTPPPYVPRKSKWIAGLLAFFIPGTGHFYLGQMVKGVIIMLLIAADICAITFAGIQMDNVLLIVLLSLLLPIIYFYSLFDAIQSTDVVNQPRLYPQWPGPVYGMPPGPAPTQPGSVSPGYAPTPAEPAAGYTDPSVNRQTQEYEAQASGPHVPLPQPPGPTPNPDGFHRALSTPAVILLGAVVVVLLLAANMGRVQWPFHSSSSFAGAVVLIAAGIGLWIWESRKQHGKKE